MPYIQVQLALQNYREVMIQAIQNWRDKRDETKQS
jgi:hypothetical protein